MHVIETLKLVNTIRFKDIPYMVKLAITFIPGKLYKLKNSDIWIISEYPENARDNGYWLFKYVREHYPDKKVYYPIKKEASDFFKIEKYGNYFKPGGLRHYFLFWAANKYIGTTKYHGFPDERISAGIYELGLSGFKYIFLNHGFTRGHSNIVDGRKTSYDLIFAISEIEKKVIVNLNYQKEEKVKAVGFCRHDNLNDSLLDSKMILIMPTWRRWLDYRHVEDPKQIEGIKKEFLKSSYYRKYLELIQNHDFLEFLEKNDLRVTFYLHGYAQGYWNKFNSPSDRIVIAKKEDCFVQDLLKRAAFLVTDYSSVAADYAYMKKPMLYFQFDAEEFAKKQYAGSKYYDFKDNGFGPVVTEVDEVISEIKKSYMQSFIMEKEYVDRVNAFFPYFDTRHCERAYDLIDQL